MARRYGLPSLREIKRMEERRASQPGVNISPLEMARRVNGEVETHLAENMMARWALDENGNAKYPLYRKSCSCGWGGCWWPTQRQATESFSRHVFRIGDI
jgi:hypothetical protein